MTFRDYSYGFNVLGEGFSSTVYKAKKYRSSNFFPKIENQFALKIIKEDFFKSETQKKLLLNEIKVHQAIKHHPNFVNLIQHGPFLNTYVFVMELCHKGSLADFLQKTKKVSEAQAIYIIKEVIEAYRLLYSLNILHRDIKPGNILITQNNQIKLCDFGLSVSQSEKNDVRAFRIGTPCFMAPQVAQSSIYTEKSDIWSIGVTYFLMLAGQLPFKSQNHQNFIKQVKQTNLETIIPSNFSEFSKQLVLRTLNPNPKERMSAQELFSFQFQNPQKQLNSYLSQKQLRSRSTKNSDRTLDKIKSTKNLDKTFTQKPSQQMSLDAKDSKKTETTQSSQSSLPPAIHKKTIVNRIQLAKKQTSLPRVGELSPRNEESPRKIPIKTLPKEVEKLIIKEMQKFTRILMNQVDFLRYISRISQTVDKYFKAQFQLFRSLLTLYIASKFNTLKTFSFIEKQKLRIFQNYPLYKAWIELIEDYEKFLNPSRQNKKITQEDLESELSNVILDIYLKFNMSIKTKLNASKLVVLDHLICLKDLLQMTKKGDGYFLKNSMLHLILEGLDNINIDTDKIQFVFTGISKKLTASNFS